MFDLQTVIFATHGRLGDHDRRERVRIPRHYSVYRITGETTGLRLSHRQSIALLYLQRFRVSQLRRASPGPVRSIHLRCNGPYYRYENCCLGSINLAKHLIWYDGVLNADVDWDKLTETVSTAVRFLDDIVTVNVYVPSIPELREAAWKGRRIGYLLKRGEGFDVNIDLPLLSLSTGSGWDTWVWRISSWPRECVTAVPRASRWPVG